MPTYAYPTAREMREIGAEKITTAAENRLGLKLMPVRRVNAGILEWTQRDNYHGLQNLRGLDGAPFHVQHVGKGSFIAQPGVFGDFMTIGETELTNRAGSVGGESVIDLTDAVTERQDILIGRELDRIEKIVWDLLVTGTFSVSSNTGVGVTFTDTYTLQTLSGSDWSTAATATPLADFRAVLLKSRGYSVNFANAIAVMNSVTFNRLMANTNDSDLHGKVKNVTAVLGLGDINAILLQAGLPKIVIYDEGYFANAADAASNTLTLFIPDDKVVVIGARTNGETVGEYRMTRNTVNPGYAPGSYDVVKNMTGTGPDGQQMIPPKVEVHRGHNGGPILYFPSAIVVMSV